MGTARARDEVHGREPDRDTEFCLVLGNISERTCSQPVALQIVQLWPKLVRMPTWLNCDMSESQQDSPHFFAAQQLKTPVLIPTTISIHPHFQISFSSLVCHVVVATPHHSKNIQISKVA